MTGQVAGQGGFQQRLERWWQGVRPGGRQRRDPQSVQQPQRGRRSQEALQAGSADPQRRDLDGRTGIGPMLMLHPIQMGKEAGRGIMAQPLPQPAVVQHTAALAGGLDEEQRLLQFGVHGRHRRQTRHAGREPMHHPADVHAQRQFQQFDPALTLGNRHCGPGQLALFRHYGERLCRWRAEPV